MLVSKITDHTGHNTVTTVQLKRRNRIDCLILFGLIAIIIYRDVTTDGAVLTLYLLNFTMQIVTYISYIRWPELLYKAQGFFYENIVIYDYRIKTINLSEEGILAINLGGGKH